MIIIKTSPNFRAEKDYVFSVIFECFFGVKYSVLYVENHINEYVINVHGKQLVFSDSFFSKITSDSYLELCNIPKHIKYGENPFLPEGNIPIIYGDSTFNIFEKKILCGIDVFASIFFMLVRWEEYVNKERDMHNRFPAYASLAYKYNFLLRPVVNEYIEMLWSMIRKLGFNGVRKHRDFRFIPSHDVDNPFEYYFDPISSAPKHFISTLLKKKSLKNFLQFPFLYTASKLNPCTYDPYYTFNTIMNISEEINVKSTFYFITDSPAGKIDGNYDVFHPRLISLINYIYSRGHTIGLHGSYNSYNDKDQLKKEFLLLLKAAEVAKVNQGAWGNRQHFLRWDSSLSHANLDSIGINYDSTLTYADHVGFRCGVCYEYPMFDFLNRKKLEILQFPLIVMECSLLDKRYMNKNILTANFILEDLYKKIKKYSGNFTVLWHNTRFVYKRDRNIYRKLLCL